MSGVFGYSREAVRVKVKKYEGSQPPELRKFSVDPQITSFEVLQSILAKAFDLKGDFAICYRLYDVSGHETYMPLLSDWDLDAAFLKAYNMSVGNSTEPCLCLRVDLKPFEECSDDWELKQNLPIITQIRTSTCQEAKPSPRLHGIFNQMGKTFNLVQRAFLGDDGNAPLQPPRPPLSDSEFRSFLDPVGQIIYAKELRNVIYFGGIDPSLRKVVWKHLLNVYPEGMTGRERMDYIKRKAAEYVTLRETWKAAIAQGPVAGELAYTTGMVRKDVLRTDRHHPFYAGSDDNQNIASLFNILTTYALNHPKVSYCQGMSDLASPLLVTMNDEAHAYICFCALMQRLSTNFMIDGIAMTQKFTHLAEGLMYYDSEFYNYLKSHQADDLLFCYRWLLLEMKREFAFEDSLRMLEVLWSSLPSYPPENELKLYDIQFQPISATPPMSPLVKTPRENAYTKVCALRRQSSSISLSNYTTKKSGTVKRQNHSLDETISKSRNNILDIKLKHQSLDDAALSQQKLAKSNETSPKNAELSPRSPKNELRPRSVSPLEAKSDSYILYNGVNNAKKNSLSSSMTSLIKTTKKSGHFKDLKDRIAAAKLFSSLERLDNSIKEENETQPKGKMVKNLNEFLNFAAANKNKFSDKLVRMGTSVSDVHKPKILLTKSSFDDSESSSLDKTRHYSSTSNEDTFDEYSPDDSQEYFPLTTSVTRELRLELENLDRKVFGDKYIERLSESPSTDGSSEVKTERLEEITKPAIPQSNRDKEKRKSDDIFVWENPLLSKTSPTSMQTPDEQADLEYDSEMPTLVNETSATKTVTPIKVITSSKSAKKVVRNEKEELSHVSLPVNGAPMTNSCEEVTETIRPSLLPPPKEFGGGNAFLMFLCITVLLQHRDHIISKGMDYNEMAMHFDKMVRKHDVTRVLNQARQMHARYIKQHTIAQQKQDC
ncbi:TBC1 domain family member 25 isoform X3 [Tribolium madens]|uniref:TBC1 domain family member 25 isoform X3 n=1 Tax=Tribolium madens TaxID=41895 RepID=UPI001CF74FB3|nr:TBC1 domain family member 25 isoform X3 [Tribolium madens]